MMSHSRSDRRRGFAALLIAVYVSAHTPWAVALAQSGPTGPDSTPPTVVHTPPDVPMALNEPFVVHAVVTDNVAVARVRLYFRAEGAEGYRTIEMAPARGGSYRATIPAHHPSDRAIEYFIQAEDTAGNIGLRGGAFEPLRIADPSAAPPGEFGTRLAMQTPAEPEQKPWYKKWWVWTIAGAVIIGAVAGGGGGGGGEEPAPGTATITAPIP